MISAGSVSYGSKANIEPQGMNRVSRRGRSGSSTMSQIHAVFHGVPGGAVNGAANGDTAACRCAVQA